MNSNRIGKIIYFIAFVEGAAVMGVELAGVKMIAPFYGTTLYVWAAVLTVTLGGLALGYFLGGKTASHLSGARSCPLVLLIGALLISLMPAISANAMVSTYDLGIRWGSLVSATLFIMPPLICMGMISPIIIQLGIKELNKAGKIAGTVYAISTTGGIAMTLIVGFYLLPEWGIRNSIWLISGMVGGTSIICFFLLKKYIWAAMAIIIVSVSVILVENKQPVPNSDQSSKVLHQSEGILGQITVYDYRDPMGRIMRSLLINGTSQNLLIAKNKPVSAWRYPHHLATLASIKPGGAKALLIGLAGGSVAMELAGMGYDLDVVEIDNRMPFLAEKYFGFDKKGMNIIIDDGRHYINKSNIKYDLVILDVVNGEVQPHHLYTKEAFENLRIILQPDALVIINYQGYILGPNGMAARSIIKTLESAGLHSKHYFNPSETSDADIIIVASLHEQDFKRIDESRLNLCCQILAYDYSELITEEKLDLTDAIILTDDRPVMELLNIHWTEEWRKRRIEDYAGDFDH